MSLESAQRMYDAQEPCENCGMPTSRRFCSENCAKEYKLRDDEIKDDDYLVDERR
jgi:hypothetical protein